MAKAIINKHIDSKKDNSISSLFDSNIERSKGEIVVCNDPDEPAIFIMTTDGTPVGIKGGGGSGGSSGSYDDTAIWDQVNENEQAIEELKKGGMSSTLPEDIVVAGLGDDQFGSGHYKDNDVIRAGTPIYEILQNLLSKELYPSSVKTKRATATPNMSSLTCQLSSSGTVEVGTLVTLKKCQTNGTTVSVTNSTISDMTYGYSKNNNSIKFSSDTSISSECTTSISDNNYTLSATINGFDADLENHIQNTPDEQSGVGSVSLEETDLGCVSEGENKITVHGTGAKFTYHADAIDRVYYCSNLGNTNDKYYASLEEVNGTTEKASRTASLSVTGKYKYFLGYAPVKSADEITSDIIRSLNVKTGFIEPNKNTVIVSNEKESILTSNGNSIIIACPKKYALSTIFDFLGTDMKVFFSESNVQVKTGEINSDYTVYLYKITNNTQVQFYDVQLTPLNNNK